VGDERAGWRRMKGSTSPMEAIRGSSKQVEFAKMTSPSDQSKSRNEPYQWRGEDESGEGRRESYHIDISSLMHSRRQHVTELFIVFVNDGGGLLVQCLQDLNANASREVTKKSSRK
jgi:hypothetical protein